MGKATVERLVKNGAKVVICDLPTSKGSVMAEEIGDSAIFAPCDVSELYYPLFFFFRK